MGIFSIFKKQLATAGKKTNHNLVYGSPLPYNSRSNNYVSTALLKTMPDLVSAIQTIANDVSLIELDVKRVKYDNNQNIKSQELTKKNSITYLLQRRMNEFQTTKQFLQTYIHHMYEYGRFIAFIYKEKGVVQEIIPLNPEAVKITTDEKGNRIFVYAPYEDEKILILNNDILFIPWEQSYQYTDVDFRKQYSSMLSMFADLYDLDSSLLANKANVMFHIEVPEALSKSYGEEDDSENQLNQIKKAYNQMLESARNDGQGVFITDPSWKISKIAGDNNAKKATLDSESQKDMIRKISRAFRIPMSYLGYEEDSTADAPITRLNYLRQAVQPWIELLVSVLNDILFKKDMSFSIDFNLDSLLKVSLQELSDSITKLANSGTMTPNEIRSKYLKLGAVEGGNVLYGNSTLIPIKEQTAKIKATTAKLKAETNNIKNQVKGGNDG